MPSENFSFYNASSGKYKKYFVSTCVLRIAPNIAGKVESYY